MKRSIIQHVLRIQGKDMKPYLIGNLTYLLHIQIQKPFTAKQISNDDQNAYDESLK